MAIIEETYECKPLYIVWVDGNTYIVDSFGAVKSLWHGVSGAQQIRIDNRFGKKEYLEIVRKFGSKDQYEYFKSLVDQEESHGIFAHKT
ncbi:MAG: hypothetical protein IE881_07165 [Epsilonproteobacteria bacterium]|nr:hypothetical protein [Campylobacterota bacterium]